MSKHNQEEKQSNKGNPLASEENASAQAIEGVLERVAEKDPQAALDIRGYIAVQQVTHQGPMPSPDDLKQYFHTQSDLPERMMKMAEYSLENKAQHHRKILELKEKEIELQQLELIKAVGAPCYLTKFRDSCRRNSFTYAANRGCSSRPASATD